MATLFERLIGLNLPDVPTVNETKMAIHAFDACMDYIGTTIPGYGPITTTPNITLWFNLDAAQQIQMVYLSDLIDDAAAANIRIEFSRANKNYMYNGEWNTAPQWQDETAYWDTLQLLITNAGGTPTPKPF